MKHAQQLVARAIEPLSVAAEFAKNIRRCCPDLRQFLRDVQEPRARRRSRCVSLARTWFTVAICIGRTPRGARGTARDRARREVVVAVPDRAKAGNPPTSWRSPGRPNSACAASGGAWMASAATAARSSRSPLPASSPASAGHSLAPTETAGAQRRVRRRRGPTGHQRA